MVIGMRLERRGRAAVATELHWKWRLPVATEEADHAQVEGSSAAPFPRTEPASDRPRLFHFPKHGPRICVCRASGRSEVAVAGGLGGPADRAGAVSAASRSLGLAEASGAGLDQGPRRPADAQGPDAATGVAGRTREQPRGLWL